MTTDPTPDPITPDRVRALLAERDALKAKLDAATELLAYIPSYETGPCRFDHHGCCQDHPGGEREGGCWVPAARSFVEAITAIGEA